jgi:hypothetical protein
MKLYSRVLVYFTCSRENTIFFVSVEYETIQKYFIIRFANFIDPDAP